MLGLLGTIYLSLVILPPRPSGYGKRKNRGACIAMVCVTFFYDVFFSSSFGSPNPPHVRQVYGILVHS